MPLCSRTEPSELTELVPGAGPEGNRVLEFTIDAADREHWEKILRAIGSTPGARVLD